MTHEERKRFGEAVRAARIERGWSAMQLIGAVMLESPTLVPSTATMIRLENGGLTPSEEAKGLKTKDTERNAEVRRVVAKVLGLTVPAAIPAPEVKAASPVPKKVPAGAVPQKKGMDAARAVRDANRAAGKPQGRSQIPKMVKFYTSLTTDHGFSLGAIRATLRQLTALGISTDSVRGEIKSKFAHYIDTLDV